ncbi:MAG: response regulator [Candidatus Methylacidiphilales bacterium]
MRNLTHSHRLLCVDDNATFLGLLQLGLESYGYEVITAAHGLDALMQYHAHSGGFLAIISDCDMPKMTGAEFTAELRSRGYKGAIVIMSGHMPGDLRVVFRDSSISRFYRKPFHIKNLVTDLNLLCCKKDQPESHGSN